jgi:hypothetical protein
MTTNEEIGNIKDEFIHKHNLPHQQYKRLVELCDLVEKVARAATAKEIFRELEKMKIINYAGLGKVTIKGIKVGKHYIIGDWTKQQPEWRAIKKKYKVD